MKNFVLALIVLVCFAAYAEAGCGGAFFAPSGFFVQSNGFFIAPSGFFVQSNGFFIQNQPVFRGQSFERREFRGPFGARRVITRSF